MDRLRSGFHRKPRKESPSRPTVVTDTDSDIAPVTNGASGRNSGKTTPEHGPQQPIQIPYVPNKKASPFRTLRDLSRSHKRARSPATGSDSSPISALSARGSPVDRPAGSTGTSPHPLSAVARNSPEHAFEDALARQQRQRQRQPKMPSFLTLSPQRIDAKFREILWLEHNRMIQAVANPSPDFRWASVIGNHLRKLDRYMNIQPWENNRVRLRVPAGNQDYINASPITLSSVSPRDAGDREEEPDRYIAMQGPKQKTTDHVWRMVVEQLESPAVIVMLTETHEANIEKCYPYFPRNINDAPLAVGRRDEFGDGFRASVRCEAIEETEAGDAIELRKLVVKVYKRPTKEVVDGAVGHPDENGDVKMLSPTKAAPDDGAPVVDDNDAGSVTVEVGQAADEHDSEPPQRDSSEDDYEERTVWHFLYKKWPDFGVPALEDLNSFFTLMRLSREKNAGPANPRIVHCSAGVGRSGTFIALEHLMREMDAGVLEDWDSKVAASRHARTTVADGGNDEDDAASTEGHNGHLEEPEAAEKDAAADAAQMMDVEEASVRESAGNDDDLIFHTVNQLREQRRNMVQAEAQFHFIYQVVRKLWEDKHGSPLGRGGAAVDGSDLPDHGSDGEPAAKRFEFDPFVEE